MATRKTNNTPKTKVTARKNPAAKINSATATAPGSIVTEIQMVPLNQLALSPKNVRKVPPSEKDDAELLASIRGQGVKQNLVVHAGEKDTFLVDAGGRRLKALQTLAGEGVIANDYPVACLVEDEDTATLSSTTENTQRTAMHPADEFTAFASMIDEGRSEEEIALKFGVSIDLVRRRLKLARVAPEIIEAFREGDLNLECIMVFTITDHHDRQITAWHTARESHSLYPHHIKRQLTETSYSANSKLGKFVGQEVYEAAGGIVMSDLFSDQDKTYFENPELIERLALEKLQQEAEAFVGDWKWVDAHMELDQGALRSFGRVQALDLPDDHELLKEQETLCVREQKLAKLGDERDLTNEEAKDYETIENRLYEIDDDIEAAKPFSDEDRAIAGVVLTIGWQGQLEITKGLVRPEDIPAPSPETENGGEPEDRITSPTSSSPAPVADPAAVMRKAEGMPNSLADDLRTARHHILRAHLSADYDVAYDAMLYSMCRNTMSVGGIGYRSDQPLDLSLSGYYAPNGEKLVSGSVADRMLEAIKDTLQLDWMELEQPSDFKAMCLLPIEDKQALFAFAAAYAVKAQLTTDNRPQPVIEELGARMDVDVAACWRPTAANYFGKVTKAHIASVAKDVIGLEFAEERSSEKKGEAAAAMEQAFSENAREAAGLDKKIAAKSSRWLPKGMEFTEANYVDEMIDEEDQIDGEKSIGDEDLPAFLSNDTAA